MLDPTTRAWLETELQLWRPLLQNHANDRNCRWCTCTQTQSTWHYTHFHYQWDWILSVLRPELILAPFNSNRSDSPHVCLKTSDSQICYQVHFVNFFFEHRLLYFISIIQEYFVVGTGLPNRRKLRLRLRQYLISDRLWSSNFAWHSRHAMKAVVLTLWPLVYCEL